MLPIFRSHRAALFVALLVGVIYLAPHILFIVSLGGAYQGIPMLATPNEDSYLGRIHDIVDGHGVLGSPFFFEYKAESPLSPPTGEWFYALPSMILRVSPAAVLIASKFILPTILFLLVYALIFRLVGDGGWQGKLTAVAGGLLVVLGYDLIDYRTVLLYLSGADSPGSFLLWARPVNPIFGALFLFSFLLFVWAIVEQTKRRKSAVVGAAAFLAFMFASYFFSWGMALSVLAALILLLLLRKEYQTAGTLALIAPLGVLLALPYWLTVWRASQSPWYEGAVLRSGLFLTHYPLLNKLLLATLLFFILAVAFDFFWKRKKEQGPTFSPLQGPTLRNRIESWHLFCLALLLGGLWAYSQQMVTGRTIWPYHFVQYTIPFSLVVGMVVAYRVIREYSRFLWVMLVAVAILASFAFGIYTQASTYIRSRPYYANLQNYAPLFAWLNAQEKDCVVFTNENSQEMSELNTLIPAFTHCNRYSSTELYSLIPEARGLHNYLALLRLRGMTPDAIEEYFQEHRGEAAGYLYSNWQGLFRVKDFPDFSDALLEGRLAAFPAEYRAYAARDFETELLRYRMDYILSAGPLERKVANELPNLHTVFESEGLVLYAFR